MTQPSPFILELQRLHARQLDAETPEDRVIADRELAHFLREHSRGRWTAEPFDVRAAAARNDA